jgi:hypothetical protein
MPAFYLSFMSFANISFNNLLWCPPNLIANRFVPKLFISELVFRSRVCNTKRTTRSFLKGTFHFACLTVDLIPFSTTLRDESVLELMPGIILDCPMFCNAMTHSNRFTFQQFS